MANRTDPLAKSIRGTNPQYLVEKILRTKIYQNTYWKEQCFGLMAETLHLGGTHGRHPQTHPFHVSCYEDAPDSTRQGNRRRVHQKSRVQVCARAWSFLFATHGNRC
ncbi:U4/U6-U5 snRNP complex subunit prp38 [Orobanche minor]